MNVLGIIPARGGSKRVVKKNIRLLNGKPLIQYTIDVALKVNNINKVIVSTDSEEIATIAKECGADVPFIRPSRLAKDSTPDQPVIKHAVEYFIDNTKFKPDIILNLRPTSPFKSSSTIKKVIEKQIRYKADIVKTISKVTGVNHPYWMYSISNNEKISQYNKEIKLNDYYQSQLLPALYRINGVVDSYSCSTILHGDILNNNNMFGFITSEEESFDIDTEFDFKICESLFKV